LIVRFYENETRQILNSRSLPVYIYSVNPIERASAAKSSKIIKEVRHQRGWTQAELANKLGISQSALSKLEAGKLVPSSLLWFSFCAMAEIQPESLVTGVPEKIGPFKAPEVSE
jgi:DNA-binding XRE family transcriptional regulator